MVYYNHREGQDPEIRKEIFSMDRVWLGQNLLAVRFEGGRFVVHEDWEDWGIVFEGTLEEAYAYTEARRIAYLESIVG
jgi:hypothetical protein